jgi:hypothetical protein
MLMKTKDKVNKSTKLGVGAVREPPLRRDYKNERAIREC